MIPHDRIGDIVIVKFPYDMKFAEKKKIARGFLKVKGVVTVLEKSEKIKGRLRVGKTKFVAGENKRDTIHIENGCRFLLNVDDVYFSPRLASQRGLVADEICNKVNSGRNKILVMFAGVAPFPIVIAKRLKEKGKFAHIVSNEINRKASKFAEENVRLNKVGDYVRVVQGDAKKLKLKGKFDFIVMPRPNLKDTFLDVGLKFAKKGGVVYYYGFGERGEVVGEIKRDGGGKIGKVRIEKAGEIAPYKFRWLAKFRVC